MKRRKGKPPGRSPGAGIQNELLFFFVLSLLFLLVYLWGKIEIDFQNHENVLLEQKVDSLLHRIEDLQITVERLRSVKRIEQMAGEMGMVHLPGSSRENLIVDLEGLPMDPVVPSGQIRMAGFSPFPMVRRVRK